MTRLAAYRWAFAACALAVLVLALLPVGPTLPTTGWDKANHLLAFATLATLGRGALPGRWVALLAALLAFGGAIEVLQSFTDDRSAEWGDLLADAIGLGLARLAFWLHERLPVLRRHAMPERGRR